MGATGELLAPAGNMILGGFSGGWMKWLFIGLLGLSLLFGIGYLIKNSRKEKRKWNKIIRVYQEDPTTGKIPFNPYVIKACGVVLKGARLIYLKKPLLGGKLLPLLNHYTRPGVYDIIITADNRFFLVNGITGIDKQRKELGVGIRYPGIDHQFDEINTKYASMNQTNSFDRTLEILKKAAPIIFAIVLLVALIVGGNYLVQHAESQAIKSQAELEMMEIMKDASIMYKESGDSMVVVLDQIKDITGTRNLKSYVDNVKSGVIS